MFNLALFQWCCFKIGYAVSQKKGLGKLLGAKPFCKNWQENE